MNFRQLARATCLVALVIGPAWLASARQAIAQGTDPAARAGSETTGVRKRRAPKRPSKRPGSATPAAGKPAAAPAEAPKPGSPDPAAVPAAPEPAPGLAPSRTPAASAAAVVTQPVPADILQTLDTTVPSRIVITEFVVTGETVPPALLYQLQDGFVLGLVRNGVQVIDHEELPRRLERQPELIGCDTSPCLKKLGELLKVRFVLKIDVTVTGNSYRMMSRVFRTNGAAPAAFPVENQSRFCDVCTVTEAREAMLLLAQNVRVPDEPTFDDLGRPVASPPAPRAPSLAWPLSALGGGLIAVVAGSLILANSGDRAKGEHAFGGALLGLGAGVAVVGLYRTVQAWHTGSRPRTRPAPAN